MFLASLLDAKNLKFLNAPIDKAFAEFHTFETNINIGFHGQPPIDVVSGESFITGLKRSSGVIYNESSMCFVVGYHVETVSFSFYISSDTGRDNLFISADVEVKTNPFSGQYSICKGRAGTFHSGKALVIKSELSWQNFSFYYSRLPQPYQAYILNSLNQIIALKLRKSSEILHHHSLS